MTYYFNRRLASAEHYAYDVIEMSPLRRQHHLWGYRSRTLKLTLTLTLFLTLTRTIKIKEHKNDTGI